MQILHNTLKLQYFILILLFLKKIIDYLPIEHSKKISHYFLTPSVSHSGRLLPQNNDQILEGYWISEQNRDPCNKDFKSLKIGQK